MKKKKIAQTNVLLNRKHLCSNQNFFGEFKLLEIDTALK